MLSELTYKIVAFSEVPNFNTDDCIDWAIEMISLGYESEYLLILSGLDKPTNYFETINYLKKALQELKLKEKTSEEAILSYSSYYINKIANSINIRDNLHRVYEFCQQKDYEGIIYDFFLLYWAWDDLDYDDKYENHYWPDANRANIEEIVVKTATNWIHENKQKYEITI